MSATVYFPKELLLAIAECNWRTWILMGSTCKTFRASLINARFESKFTRRLTIYTDYYHYESWVTPTGETYRFMSVDDEDFFGCNIWYYRKDKLYKLIEWRRASMSDDTEGDCYIQKSVDYYDEERRRITKAPVGQTIKRTIVL